MDMWCLNCGRVYELKERQEKCWYDDCDAGIDDGIIWEIAFEQMEDVPEKPERDVIYVMV